MANVLSGETMIPLKKVMSLPCHAARPSYSTVRSWVKRGVVIDGDVFKLSSRRSGGRVHTSVEEVERFVAKINGDEPPAAVVLNGKPRRPLSGAKINGDSM